MGITDFLDSMFSAISFTEAHADAPAEDDDSESKDDDSEEKEGDDGGEEEEGDGEEEEEEEEEEEPVDPKPHLEEECANSAKCAPYKHHFEACVERVTAAAENPEHKGHKEDCVEEFFHLQHCATACAAPKLFKALK